MIFLHSSIVHLCIVQPQHRYIFVSAKKRGPAAEDTKMSIAHNITPSSHGFFGNIRKSFAQYRTYRSTYDELDRLTERELADLGLTRGMIRSVAYQAAYM